MEGFINKRISLDRDKQRYRLICKIAVCKWKWAKSREFVANKIENSFETALARIWEARRGNERIMLWHLREVQGLTPSKLIGNYQYW